MLNLLRQFYAKTRSFALLLKLSINFNKIIFNINTCLKVFYFYLAFVGIFGFALFISEEACQVIMWGSFAAQNANRYDLLKSNCKAIDKISQTSRWINNKFMWINPFQYWSYGAFLDGNQLYVNSIQALIMANEPGLYIGEIVNISFKYETYTAAQNGLSVVQNDRIKIILNAEPKTNPVHVTGVVEADPDRAGGIIIKTVQSLL